MGRDLGYTESDGSTTLYYLKELDAEGRLKYRTQGSLNSSYKYSFTLDALGRPTQIKEPAPLNYATTISYSNRLRTVTDPNSNATTYEYYDLPGQPTKLTDAKSKAATYTYDAVGRLTSANFNNGARIQSYVYDGVDNVTYETHPETGTISYSYNTENRLSQRTWGGTSLSFVYNISGQLERMIGAETLCYYYDTKGRFQSVNSPSSGWSRGGLEYNCWGSPKRETITIPGLGSKTIQYGYDGNNNLVDTLYPDLKTAHAAHGGLNRPTSLSFNQTTIVNNGSVSFGPNKMIAGMGLGNGTTYSTTFLNNGMPDVVSLMLGASALYNADYSYDGAGNITGISSTAPANPTLSATFGYDELNRLTSADYTSGRRASYTYDYDEYGNMKTVRENGGIVFNKTYNTSNRISGYSYDARGNLISDPDHGKSYSWDSQNRLSYISDASGQFLGDYKYDDRGLRLYALPPQPDIEVVNCPSGTSSVDFTSSLNTPSDKTFTLQNLGHATLTVGVLTFTGADAGLFSVQQQPASSVSPNQSTNFIIRFRPTSTGNKTAILQIASNDPDENPYTINLNGYCEPEINVVGVPTGGIYDFGTVIVSESSTNTFMLQNLGTSNLIIYGDPIIGGANPDDFYVEQLPTSPVAASGSTTFIVRFAPNSQGAKSATFSISNNDLNENPYVINLRGTGQSGPQKVTEGKLVLTYPNGGEQLKAGTIEHISWKGGESAKAVRIEYSADNGSLYRTIVARAANIGTFPWKVPADLSSACLIRISDADGAPVAPLYISYEFNFKLSTPKDATQKAGFTFRAGVWDSKTMRYQVADITFATNGLTGSENLLFNQALAELQSPEALFNSWHHARVQYDMSNYSGSVWVDDQPVIYNAPLDIDLKAKSAAEISIQGELGVPLKLWLDDVEVKFIDQSSPQPDTEVAAFMHVFRDRFSTYENGLFLSKGGWVNVRESAAGGDREILDGTPGEEGPGDKIKSAEAKQRRANNVQTIDGIDYASSARSLRLENGEACPAYVSKKISLPPRIPFVISADNFSIVKNNVQVAGNEGQAKNRSEAERERTTSERSEGKRNPPSSQADKNAASSRPSSNAQKPKSATITSTASGTKSATKTFSASPAGGTYYIYSFNGRLLAEYNLYGTCVRDYIYFGGQLVAEYDAVGQQVYYYTSDQINSTRMVTNSTGAVVHAAAYDPYGGIQTPQTWPNAFNPTPKFSGKERDGESELDYFGSRYYDHSIYRFLSVDPIVLGRAALSNPQRWNQYAYCLGNPTSYVDPKGADPITIQIARIMLDGGSGSIYGTISVSANGQTKSIGWTLESWMGRLDPGTYGATLVKKKGTYNDNFYDVIEISNPNIRLANLKISTMEFVPLIPYILAGDSVGELHSCIYVSKEQPKNGITINSWAAMELLVDTINYYRKQMAEQVSAAMVYAGRGLYGSPIDQVLNMFSSMDCLGYMVSFWEDTQIRVVIKDNI